MKNDLKKMMPPKTIKSKSNGCGTAPGNLVYFILFPYYFDVQEVLEGLVERGHTVKKIDKFGSVVVGIEKGDDGRVYANADFRKAGGVDGF